MSGLSRNLLVATTLAISLTACGPTHSSVPPVLAADPKTILQEADALASQGDNARALEKYLWLVDNSVKIDPAFLGVRDTILLESLVTLAARYEPAAAAIRSRQTALERRLLRAPSSVDTLEIALFASLNAKVGEDARTASVLGRIAKTPETANVRRVLVRLLLGRLLETNDGGSLLRNYDDVRSEILDERDTLKHHQNRLLEKVYRIYELMLNGNNLEQAKSMVDLALEIDSTNRSFVQLLSRSNGPGRDAIAEFVLDRARQHLPTVEVERLRRENTK